MAYAASGLVLWAHGNDKKLFRYDSSADTLATISAASYFANTANLSRLSVNDIIYAVGSDTSAFLKVSAVAATTGNVTTVPFAGASAGEVASTTAAMSALGISLISSTGANAFTLPGPIAGVRKVIYKSTTSTASQTVTLSTGAIASTTGVTQTIMTFSAQGQSVTLEGLPGGLLWGISGNTGAVTFS